MHQSQQEKEKKKKVVVGSRGQRWTENEGVRYRTTVELFDDIINWPSPLHSLTLTLTLTLDPVALSFSCL